MKKLICVCCIWLVGISTFVFAESMEVVNAKNEFGGKTEMTMLASGDLLYKMGVAKKITHYDGSGKIMKVESFYTAESARKDHIARAVFYYGSNGKMMKVESFPTDDYVKKEGTSTLVKYYDGSEKKVKTELFYTAEFTRKNGFIKAILYYDGNEKLVREEYHAENGYLLKREANKN